MEETKAVKDVNATNAGQKKITKTSLIQQSFSIDETKLSSLIICLFSCMLFGGYNYIMIGDITTNLTSVITALIYSIAGVNITNSVMNYFENNRQQKPAAPKPVTREP